ncbi:hypothetical protein CRYUN_Cryun19dG0066700 [Craigia yunnanensis]
MISSSTKPPLTTPPSKRIAEAMDFEIKCWAAGKEGNMRAFLSSLQQVLWSECGWEPVSLTDLITSGSDKKVYRKATLCVHPDKVQQKGATLEQKYITEKVFDFLKKGNQQGIGADNMHCLNDGLWKNERVGIISDDDDRVEMSSSSAFASSHVECGDSPKEQLSVHGSDGQEIEQENAKVVISPDFMFCRGIYCTKG